MASSRSHVEATVRALNVRPAAVVGRGGAPGDATAFHATLCRADADAPLASRAARRCAPRRPDGRSWCTRGLRTRYALPACLRARRSASERGFTRPSRDGIGCALQALVVTVASEMHSAADTLPRDATRFRRFLLSCSDIVPRKTMRRSLQPSRPHTGVASHVDVLRASVRPLTLSRLWARS